MARNFILISGGPGSFDSQDPEHDLSWSNYIDCPLLLSKDSTPPVLPVENDEEVWWFVFKPAIAERWTTDNQRTDSAGKKAVKDVTDAGFSSYANLIEGRATSRGWNLRWLDTASDLWTKLGTFNDPISKVYYWGHASDDLWLSIRRDSSHQAIAPPADRIITIASIASHASLKPKFQAGSAFGVHRFVGCNTSKFAKQWTETFKVHSEGVVSKVDFKTIFSTGGEPSLVTGASRVVHTP